MLSLTFRCWFEKRCVAVHDGRQISCGHVPDNLQSVGRPLCFKNQVDVSNNLSLPSSIARGCRHQYVVALCRLEGTWSPLQRARFSRRGKDSQMSHGPAFLTATLFLAGALWDPLEWLVNSCSAYTHAIRSLGTWPRSFGEDESAIFPLARAAVS